MPAAWCFFVRAAITAAAVGALVSGKTAATQALRRAAPALISNEVDNREAATTPPQNRCHPNPCKHGATCTEGGDGGGSGGGAGYACACNAGFTGPDCDTNVDGCASYVCAHGGLCVDGVNGPVCMCIDGFAGDKCHIYPDPCAAVPCQNGGTCDAMLSAPSAPVAGEKWCVTEEKAMCVRIHWTFPEQCSKEECAARCDAATWTCTAFSYWRGHCWLCAPGTGIRTHENLVGTKYYIKAPASIPGETCIGDSVASDQRYTPGKYTCACHAGFTGVNCTVARTLV
jgi:hypothetical protein